VARRRVVLAIPLLFIVSILSFALLSFTPGSAATLLLGTNATPEEVAALSKQMGIDRPVYEQYWEWLSKAVHGDLGISLLSKESVATVITGPRLAVTLSLLLGALTLSLVFGVAFGMIGAIRGGAVGRVVDSFSVAGYAIPSFWMGAILISVFAVKLGWLPATGYVPFRESPSEWARSLILPWIALSLGPIAALARYTREAMLDVLSSEHVRMLWANGIPPRKIYFKHALKNSAPRIMTILGLIVVGLLTGTVLVEAVFALPGEGQLVVMATNSHDVPMIQGIVLMFTLVVIAVNLFVDLAYTWLNPRVSTS
jgi:peptide/nickel transport system permease protein